MNQSLSRHFQSSSEPGGRQSGGQGQASEEEVIDLGAILGTLWRGKWIIAICMVVAIMMGGYYAYKVAVPEYTASADVMLNPRKEQVVNLASVVDNLSTDSKVMNSEILVMRSRQLLGQVVDRLDLTSDPEFNGSLRPPSSMDRLKTRIRNLMNPPTEAEIAQRTTISDSERQARIRNAAINVLNRKLSISILGGSLVFRITATTEEPAKSALIADTLVDVYIADQLGVKFDATEQATTWLSERVAELLSDLESASEEVKAFSTQTDLISQETLDNMGRQLKDLRDRIASTLATQEENAAKLTALSEAQTPQQKAEILDDPQLDRMLSSASATAVAQAEQRITLLTNRLEQDRSRAESQLTALQASEEQLSEQIESQSRDLFTLQQLQREADASRLLYEHFLSRLKELSVQEGIQQADSRLLSEAVVSFSPSAPNKQMILAFSGFLGAVVGVAVILFMELRQNTFRTAQALEAQTGRPVVGQIPLLPVKRRGDTIGYLKSRPTSAAAEAVRNLRTSVLLSNVDQPPQVILNSSAVPGEGKTTVSISLAQNMAGMGRKVLLIEGDIRRRVFGQYLKTEQEHGLISVLSGETTLAETVIHDERLDADVLIGENSSVNAADLFSSQSFGRMIEEARQHYDQIIIDTPPVLVVPDARVIAQHVDAILFVVHWDRTERGQVEAALDLFESVNHPVNGLVLNKISPAGMRRYGYGHKYGYGYGYGYGGKYYVN
ncbi:polysaccharide biosynthesis tyrosine autokinase [Pseudooceanicola marinus]|uniref:polysaccharide biosynthesis tyrosine autokinase n=1 Tax=Pseudooceanicola marinus TaxID=396013 RepID=UPI001CD4E083|nr:polysaccharide biosynthesis tyrosine autokinase [Pseudooceanicola marinus]MCA1338148.1 polysaccharide biosynthesis tyrosine autokinase [Pseudooceanicola marinus]